MGLKKEKDGLHSTVSRNSLDWGQKAFGRKSPDTHRDRPSDQTGPVPLSLSVQPLMSAGGRGLGCLILQHSVILCRGQSRTMHVFIQHEQDTAEVGTETPPFLLPLFIGLVCAKMMSSSPLKPLHFRDEPKRSCATQRGGPKARQSLLKKERQERDIKNSIIF
ncbi:hypothetical protein CCH79_00011308 [Gambusia affinis]|uniref:Uncharacterized protein n=1 Tax=Gambusia affinis TaxID=33528 RepID=A0A315V2S2_GAMAF|nr:hypothetical protein CCH79_00011308 [Gambusia affinis]